MTKLIERTGDIFTTTAQGIGHGVNTEGLMGAGIAKQFRSRFGGMFLTYRDLCATGGLLAGECHTYQVDDRGEPQSWVFNIASQAAPGADARLEWLTSAVARALHLAHARDVWTIALPQIGCGIGGLSWGTVLPVLRELAENSPVDIEAWTFA